MTTEITHSLICSLSISPPAVSSFSLTSAHFLPLSSLIFVFSFYPLPVLLSASPSFYFRALSLCLSTCFLYLPALSFSALFCSHFPLSISSAASVDHLSKCQMAILPTVGIINSFLVSNTETETRGAKQ